MVPRQTGKGAFDPVAHPINLSGKTPLGKHPASCHIYAGVIIMRNAIEQRTSMAEKIEFAVALLLGAMMGWAMLA